MCTCSFLEICKLLNQKHAYKLEWKLCMTQVSMKTCSIQVSQDFCSKKIKSLDIRTTETAVYKPTDCFVELSIDVSSNGKFDCI